MKEFMTNTILSGLNFPEGLFFDSLGNLWFVEILGGNLSRWDGQRLEQFNVDGTPNGAIIDKDGLIWFCDSERSKIRTFNPNTKVFTDICSETINREKLKRPNDLIFDPYGNILFSDHSDGRKEFISTFNVLPKGGTQAKVISSGKLFANGLALMNAGKTLVYAETYNQQLWIADWNAEKLELINERPFAKAGNGPWGPDGIAFDEYENLYVTVFNEHLINIYSKTGNLINHIHTEGSRPTSCAFDPSGKLGLVVTEAERGEIVFYPSLGKGLTIFKG